MRKLIFLDIDGTLCGRDGTIPAKAHEAIQTARQKGHLVFLCSGRSRGEIPTGIFEAGFDGLVGGAGACVEYKDEIISHRPMKQNEVDALVDYFEKYKVMYVLETNGYMYLTEDSYGRMQERFTNKVTWEPDVLQEFLGQMRMVDDCKKVPGVNKITYFDAPRPISEVYELFGEDYTIVSNSIQEIGDNSAEVSEKGVNKAEGIKILMKHLNADREDVIAIGDSTNDIEMIQLAGCGVAMGNAKQELKDAADMITDDVDEDGVYNCFKKLNLI